MALEAEKEKAGGSSTEDDDSNQSKFFDILMGHAQNGILCAMQGDVENQAHLMQNTFLSATTGVLVDPRLATAKMRNTIQTAIGPKTTMLNGLGVMVSVACEKARQKKCPSPAPLQVAVSSAASRDSRFNRNRLSKQRITPPGHGVTPATAKPANPTGIVVIEDTNTPVPVQATTTPVPAVTSIEAAVMARRDKIRHKLADEMDESDKKNEDPDPKTERLHDKLLLSTPVSDQIIRDSILHDKNTEYAKKQLSRKLF